MVFLTGNRERGLAKYEFDATGNRGLRRGTDAGGRQDHVAARTVKTATSSLQLRANCRRRATHSHGANHAEPVLAFPTHNLREHRGQQG
jgi:hypothetical protein